jgi:chromate transporter
MTEPAPVQHPVASFAEAFRLWVRIGLTSFGGPAGQIALMHKLLVDEKKWVGESRFLHALNYCMLLPGPEAQQLATYIGWLLHRTAGGLAAGILFVLPGALVILGLSILYALWRDALFVQAVFFGIKAAVLAVVVEAVHRIGKRALKNQALVAIAALAFIAIFFFEVPFPLIILAAGLLGFAGSRMAADWFAPAKKESGKSSAAIDSLIESGQMDRAMPTLGQSLRTLAIGLALWFGPLGGLALTLGPDHVLVEEGMFFSKMAVVTFGGAYAVLAYVAQQAVEVFGWMSPGEMLDGLGMAETTPGPLIMVLQFVGFLAAYRNPEPFSPLTAGLLGAAITTWVTFVPCFLWIFLGAPYIERLRNNKALSAALSAITAAVVGVVLNLAIWFGIHVLFGQVGEASFGPLRLLIPQLVSLHIAAALLSLASMIALLRFHAGMIPVLGGAAALGAAFFYLGWA